MNFDDDEGNENNNDFRRRRNLDTILQRREFTLPHVMINGTISFMNDFGFLSPGQHAIMQFHLLMTFVYGGLAFLWVFNMRKHSKDVVSIHKYLALLLILLAVCCFLMFTEYEVFNFDGKRMKLLLHTSVLMQALTNTLSRLIMLLLCLGYGIVMNVLQKYLTKIGLLMFFFAVFNALNIASGYLNQQKPLSTSIKVAVALPELILNSILLVWMMRALLRTLVYLKQKEQ